MHIQLTFGTNFPKKKYDFHLNGFYRYFAAQFTLMTRTHIVHYAICIHKHLFLTLTLVFLELFHLINRERHEIRENSFVVMFFFLKTKSKHKFAIKQNEKNLAVSLG